MNDSILSLHDYTLGADIFAVYKSDGQLSQKVVVKNDTLLYKKVFSGNSESLEEYYAVMIGKRTPIKKLYKVGDTVNIGFDVVYTDYNLLVDLYTCAERDNSNSYLIKNREVVSNHFDTTLILSKSREINTCFNIAEIKEFGIDSAIIGTNGGYELAFSLLAEWEKLPAYCDQIIRG